MDIRSILPSSIAALVHVPVGIANVYLYYYCPAVGGALTAGFLAYEFMQEWGVMAKLTRRDYGQSHRDIQGWMWGLALAGLAWGILKALGYAD